MTQEILREWKTVPHELTYTELSDRLFALVDTLMHPVSGVWITETHGDTWAWAGELLFGPCGLHNDKAMLSGSAEVGALAVNLALNMGSVPDPSMLALQSLPFVAFPYLEGLIKERCPDYVTPDGRNVRPFPRLSNQKRDEHRNLSSLADALYLLVRTSSSTVLVGQLLTILDRLADVEGISRSQANRGYTAIYNIRNRVLHGQKTHAPVGALILTIALLIGVDQVSHDYAAHRAKVAELISHRTRDQGDHPHFFYPIF